MCTECQGKGEEILAKDRCKNCEGKKTVKEKKILEVHIDRGMEDGHRITFSGEGDIEPGQEEPGDIIVVLDEIQHETFTRMQKDDLLMHMELTLTEALCGFQKVVRTLDNRNLVLTVIPGEVMKSGAIKAILGEGMPRYKNPYEKGKLIVQFLVKFPESIDPAVIGHLEQLLPPRPEVSLPSDAEEVVLTNVDYDRHSRQARARRHVYDEDDDDDRPEGPHVQCASH